ncbi:MAG: hypothetical protein WDO16_13635 [Bacteroidota bacterium]
MLLVAEPAERLLKFIQVLSWIIIPVLLSAVLVTVIVHYRRKKKEKITGKDSEEDKFMQASPEQVGYTNGNGEYILFDHSRLIQEYKNRLSFNHARYTALQKDFAAMETKYTALACYTQNRFSTHKKRTMENVQGQTPKQVEAEVNKLAHDHDAEKKELLARLDQLGRSYQSLEEENRFLSEQVSMATATGDERDSIIKKWKEENTSLRDKMAGQEYLKDILEEKKSQISFLQEQVEQRIKYQHLAEQQRQQVIAEMEEIKNESHETTKHADALKNELLLKQDQNDKMQVVLCGKEEELAEQQQVLNGKLDHIVYIENVFNETKTQNELLNAELADSKDLVNLLQQQLKEEQSRITFMEQKLQSQKQVMRRLYKEFASFVEGDNEKSPVIALRPEYGNKDSEEIAVH